MYILIYQNLFNYFLSILLYYYVYLDSGYVIIQGIFFNPLFIIVIRFTFPFTSGPTTKRGGRGKGRTTKEKNFFEAIKTKTKSSDDH